MLRRATIIFAIWTALGLFFYSQDLARAVYFDDPTPWWHALVSWLAGVWLSALLTPLVLALGDRFPLTRRRWLARGAIHAVGACGFALVLLVLQSAFAAAVGMLGSLQPASFDEALAVGLVFSVHNSIVGYLAILGVQHGLRYYRGMRARELQTSRLAAELARAQLGALKAQIQPHFLFNTLNAIMVLVRAQRTAEAEDTLGKLGELLRRVLDDALAQEVSLRRELESVQLYLGIEQLRFGDRLIVETDAAPSLLDAQVPQLGLQPLVENAVRHGVGRSAQPVTIRIAARRANGALEIEVADDGPGLDPGRGPSGAGIGIANTRARMASLYGDAASLTIANGARGVTVTMVVPYHEGARGVHDAGR